jgi:hypothetical protein
MLQVGCGPPLTIQELRSDPRLELLESLPERSGLISEEIEIPLQLPTYILMLSDVDAR